ncbi:MAG TPA: T9SS type A sorting domain-containing protein, partial [Candidatus Kapabacteria bacterium]|nr:T9SS type A sorting domain-containing protein [Candidatus Kapabacteria bacterium]
MIGYASVYQQSNASNVLWKTTDAGITWQNRTASYIDRGTRVYKTQKALVETGWCTSKKNGNSPLTPAGVSIDDGKNFNEIFSDPYNNSSNGIDFADNNIGVVTMGPNNQTFDTKANCWFTVDGGLSWTEGGPLSESWGIYALQGTSTFVVLPEGNARDANHKVFISTDNGRNWVERFDFQSGAEFTGEIGGKSSTIYVQTNTLTNFSPKGMYRSDDLGLSWKSVGGPAGFRDTKFCVTGCNGEIVYAFDGEGGIWKTTDGGDGTLFGGDSTASPLSLAFDSLNIISHYCEQVTLGFPLMNGSCSPFVIDSILITKSSSKFIQLDSPRTVLSSHTDSIRFQFQSDSNETQTVIIHLKGRGKGKIFDTILKATVTNISNGVFGPILSLQSALASIRTHYCQPGEVTIPIHNINCSTLKIDTLYLIDSIGESSISYRPLHDSIPIFSDDSIKLSFQTNTNESRNIPLRLKCTIAGRTFDTIITLDAFHSRSPEPYLGQPKPTKVGDTVLVPLYILTPTDSINIKHLAFHLKYNGDLLTPVPTKTFETNNTLCQHNKNLSGSEVSPGNLDCSIDLDKDSIYNLSDFTKPMIYVRFRVTLTTELSCPIFIDSFSIAGRTPLGLCDIPSTTFQLDPRCGDSTIWKFMRTGKIPQIISMHPNPATDNIQIDFEPAGRTSAKVQIVSALGVTVKEVVIPSETIQSFQLETASLPTGIYYARM